MNTENKGARMKLKYAINDMVYYLCVHTDRVCLGRIIAIDHDVGRGSDDPFLYCVRNVHIDKEDDFEDSITSDEIFDSEEEVYLFLRECAYNRHCKYSCAEDCMEEEDFNKAFDEKHGHEHFDAYACLDKLTIRKSNEN